MLETSRAGYLAASSASSYSMISMLQHFGPIMPEGSAAVSLTYLASERVVPGYGGGMSSAKAQLESDTRVLAWEAGRKYGIRVNTISAGPLASRAAVAIKKVKIHYRSCTIHTASCTYPFLNWYMLFSFWNHLGSIGAFQLCVH